MAENILKTRIQLKYDTYENWAASTLVLKSGEVAIATVTTVMDEVTKTPATVMKVGDGTHTFSQLPFLTAKAADVYEWAKAETKPTYGADEITGFDEAVANAVKENAELGPVTYRIVKSEVSGEHKYTLQQKLPGTDTTWQDVNTAIDLAEIYTKMGTLEESLTTLNGAVTEEGSVKKIAKDAADDAVKFLLGEGEGDEGKISEAYDTLKEIADWIEAHGTAAADLVSQLSDLQEEVEKKANDADLADIAKSGDVADLVQGETILVFNCGGASETI